MDLAGGDPRQIVADYAGTELAITRDGQRLMYSRQDQVEGRAYPRRVVIPAEGGEPLASFLLPPGAEDLKWAPDGEAVTYIDRAYVGDTEEQHA